MNTEMPETIWAWIPEILYGEFTASSKEKNPPAVEYHRAPAWRTDMENAPRDGRNIMAIRAKRGFSKIPNIIYWCEADEKWKHYQNHTVVAHEPTHWTDLITPPTEEKTT